MFIKGIKGYTKHIAKYLGLNDSKSISINSDFKFKFDDFDHETQINVINAIVEEEFEVHNFIQLWDFISAENNDWRNVIEKGLEEENDEDKLGIYSFLKDHYYNKFEIDQHEFSINDFDSDFWLTDEYIISIITKVKQEADKNSEITNLTYISKIHQSLIECILEAGYVIKNDELLYVKGFFERLIYFYKNIYDHLYTEYSGYIIKLELSYSKEYGFDHSLKKRFNFDKSPNKLYDNEVGFKLAYPIGNYKQILDLLINSEFLKKGTNISVFKSAFNSTKNKKIETPLIWKGTKRDLNYFVKELKEKGVIDNKDINYQKHWKYCEAVFRDEEGRAITNLSGNNKIPPISKKKDIDHIIRCFNKV
uniref:hypothetical protein n=1 Tax=Mariniflexile sp. TaxID=1979402 RepID=UPI0040475249